MLTGPGGNIGVSFGEDGVLLIDDKYPQLGEKIAAAVQELSDKPVRFVINTHGHFDHVLGNEHFGRFGAVIVAHENVRKRMSVDRVVPMYNIHLPASSKAALPIITFTQDITFHLNGDEIHVFHAKEAHSDSDAVVHFRKANVVHTGDLYFAGVYPVIEVGGIYPGTDFEGSIKGMIAAITYLLTLVDENTKVIPGHGPVSNKAELITYLAMLTTARDRMTKLIKEGKTQEQVIAAKPYADLDETWGKGIVSPELFVRIVYNDLSRK